MTHIHGGGTVGIILIIILGIGIICGITLGTLHGMPVHTGTDIGLIYTGATVIGTGTILIMDQYIILFIILLQEGQENLSIMVKGDLRQAIGIQIEDMFQADILLLWEDLHRVV